MKTAKFLFTTFVIIIICSSCNVPQSVNFIINETDQPVTLYSERDSVYLYPYQKTYLCEVIVEDEEFIACVGNSWMFNIFEPIKHIRLDDTLYDVNEEYCCFLADITNYKYYTSIVNTNSSISKIEGSCYDFHLSEDFIDKIISAENK